MAKKRENKNRSYREMIRRQQEEMSLLEKAKREEWERNMGLIMITFSIVTLLIVVLAICGVIGSNLLFVWAIAEIIYASCCLIGNIKTPDAVIKRTCIVMFACAGTATITALICR